MATVSLCFIEILLVILLHILLVVPLQVLQKALPKSLYQSRSTTRTFSIGTTLMVHRVSCTARHSGKQLPFAGKQKKESHFFVDNTTRTGWCKREKRPKDGCVFKLEFFEERPHCVLLPRRVVNYRVAQCRVHATQKSVALVATLYPLTVGLQINNSQSALKHLHNASGESGVNSRRSLKNG